MDDFLKAHGFSNYALEQLSGGANNRVYRVGPVILKQYFQHPEDKRQRLHAEFSFLSFAWEEGIRRIPQPLASDREQNLALYTSVPGRHFTSADLSSQIIQQAIDFFLSLNRNHGKAGHLQLASEALFSTETYIENVKGRLEKLSLADDAAVRSFVKDQLYPAWAFLEKHLSKAALQFPQDRCISPSDFGFHNALLDGDKAFFLDFEYAGWDSPVKAVCDFFCQPRVPVPMSHFDAVCDAFCSFASDPQGCKRQAELLFPLFRLKWCCMMLNRFVGAGKARRAFAQANEEDQLEKTKKYFQESLCHM